MRAPLAKKPPAFSFSAKIRLPAANCSGVPSMLKNSSASFGLYRDAGSAALAAGAAVPLAVRRVFLKSPDHPWACPVSKECILPRPEY
jgi:hypothetical protein